VALLACKDGGRIPYTSCLHHVLATAYDHAAFYFTRALMTFLRCTPQKAAATATAKATATSTLEARGAVQDSSLSVESKHCAG